MASASGIRMGKVFVEIGADPAKFFAAVGQMQRGLTRTLSGIQSNLNKLGGAMTTVGAGLAGVGAAVTAPLALASRQFAAFDDAIRLTGAASGATGADLERLNDRARDLGATTSFTAVQVAELMTELGRAGFSTDEINAMTGAVLDLARATGTDATLSSGIMAATLRQFAMDAGEATRAADILTFTANATFNSVESLGESLKYAGPVAKSLGMSLEDTAAILGALGNVGIQGSEAGTALRRLGVISAGAGEKLQKLFGVSNVDAAGNLKPLIQILDEINTATTKMTVAERTEKMAKAFGLLGITSANVLSGAADSVTELRDRMNSIDGVASKTAKQMDAGLGGAFRIALSAIQGTQLALGNALAPTLQAVINFIGQAAGAVTSFVKENGELVVSIGKGAAGVAAAGAVLLGFAAIVKAVAFGFGGLAAASTFVLGPLIAIAGASVAVGIGFVKATAGVVAYAAASVAAALASGAAWAAANIAMAGVAVFSAAVVTGLVVGLYQAVAGFGFMESAMGSVKNAARDAMGVFSELGKIGSDTLSGIHQALSAGDMESAMGIAMAGLKAAFTTGSNAFLNAVDEWGVNLINAFDFYISQIPFLRFLGQDKYTFSIFGDSTESTSPDKRADERFAALGVRQAERRGKAVDRQGELASLLGDARETGVFRSRADDVIQAASTAPSFDAMRELAQEFHELAETGRLSREQLKKYGDAVDTATDRLSENKVSSDAWSNEEIAKRRAQMVMDGQAGDLLKNIGGVGSASELEDLQGEFEALKKFGRLSGDQESSISNALALAATQFADGQQQSQAEVAGTFSSVALGGMGFGSSLMQQIAKDTKRSADANEKIAAKQEDFEIQD